MPSKPENKDRQLDQSALRSSVYSQPWWRGFGTGPTLEECTLKSSAANHPNGSLTVGATQSQANSALDTGTNGNKDTQIAVASRSGSCPSNHFLL